MWLLLNRTERGFTVLSVCTGSRRRSASAHPSLNRMQVTGQPSSCNCTLERKTRRRLQAGIMHSWFSRGRGHTVKWCRLSAFVLNLKWSCSVFAGSCELWPPCYFAQKRSPFRSRMVANSDDSGWSPPVKAKLWLKTCSLRGGKQSKGRANKPTHSLDGIIFFSSGFENCAGIYCSFRKLHLRNKISTLLQCS